jgi:hypothetical protein
MFKIFRNLEIDSKKSTDAGMAVVLILLITGYFSEEVLYFKIAIPALVLVMTFPLFYKPFAFFWFGLSLVLGTVVSKILLSIIFFLVVTPIGLLRRMFGKDSLQLRNFKRDDKTVMQIRNIKFTKEDIEVPY